MGTNLQLGTGEEEDEWSPVKMTGKQLENRSVLMASSGGQHTVLLVKDKQESWCPCLDWWGNLKLCFKLGLCSWCLNAGRDLFYIWLPVPSRGSVKGGRTEVRSRPFYENFVLPMMEKNFKCSVDHDRWETIFLNLVFDVPFAFFSLKVISMVVRW